MSHTQQKWTVHKQLFLINQRKERHKIILSHKEKTRPRSGCHYTFNVLNATLAKIVVVGRRSGSIDLPKRVPFFSSSLMDDGLFRPVPIIKKTILVGKSVPALCPRIDLRCKKCEKRETFVTSWRSYICKIVHERCTYIVCTVVVPCPGGSERKKKAVEIYYRSITFVNKIASFVLQLSRFHSHDVFSAFLSFIAPQNSFFHGLYLHRRLPA